MKRQSIVKTFIFGFTIFVLIILAGIMTGIAILPATLIAFWIGGPGGAMVMSVLSVAIGIYFLGFVFERFKIRMNKK